jgi:hypothetical protein
MPTMPPPALRPAPAPPPDDTTARLAALEAAQATQATELAEQRGQRKLLAAALAIFAATALTGAVAGIRMFERVDTITHQLAAHEALPMHAATAAALGDLRADLRVLSTQLEQIRATTSEIRAQVARVEDATRPLPAPAPRR